MERKQRTEIEAMVTRRINADLSQDDVIASILLDLRDQNEQIISLLTTLAARGKKEEKPKVCERCRGKGAIVVDHVEVKNRHGEVIAFDPKVEPCPTCQPNLQSNG